jgi:hypothetical protein
MGPRPSEHVALLRYEVIPIITKIGNITRVTSVGHCRSDRPSLAGPACPMNCLRFSRPVMGDSVAFLSSVSCLITHARLNPHYGRKIAEAGTVGGVLEIRAERIGTTAIGIGRAARPWTVWPTIASEIVVFSNVEVADLAGRTILGTTAFDDEATAGADDLPSWFTSKRFDLALVRSAPRAALGRDVAGFVAAVNPHRTSIGSAGSERTTRAREPRASASDSASRSRFHCPSPSHSHSTIRPSRFHSPSRPRLPSRARSSRSRSTARSRSPHSSSPKSSASGDHAAAVWPVSTRATARIASRDRGAVFAAAHAGQERADDRACKPTIRCHAVHLPRYLRTPRPSIVPPETRPHKVFRPRDADERAAEIRRSSTCAARCFFTDSPPLLHARLATLSVQSMSLAQRFRVAPRPACLSLRGRP